MLIKSIELNNFKIYKGKNKIEILPSPEKNVILISGNNGYGKTTLLMSLVWGLYGKQMENVDEIYKKAIAIGKVTKGVKKFMKLKKIENPDSINFYAEGMLDSVSIYLSTPTKKYLLKKNRKLIVRKKDLQEKVINFIFYYHDKKYYAQLKAGILQKYKSIVLVPVLLESNFKLSIYLYQVDYDSFNKVFPQY